MPSTFDDGVPLRSSSRKRRGNPRTALYVAIGGIVATIVGIAACVLIYYHNRQPNNPEVIFERWQKAGRDEDWSEFFDLMDENSQFMLTHSIENALAQGGNTPATKKFQGLKGKSLFMKLVQEKGSSLAIQDGIGLYLVATVVGVKANGNFADIELQMPRATKTTTIHMKWQSGGWRVVCAFIM